MKELIEKINYFSALARQRELTEKEAAERQEVRKLYLENFKNNFKQQLDTIEVVEDTKKA